LLFTGDTYYRGTVWLYRPETDLSAYDASVRRLSALGPEVKGVFGAHNVVGDPPSVLPKLVSAFEAVCAGKVAGTPGTGGKVRYKGGRDRVSAARAIKLVTPRVGQRRP